MRRNREQFEVDKIEIICRNMSNNKSLYPKPIIEEIKEEGSNKIEKEGIW